MDAHDWMFPWLSLIASLIAAIGGTLLSFRAPARGEKVSVTPLLIIVWLVATCLMVLGGLKIGDWNTIDFIPARGVLGGAIGGALISQIVRRQSRAHAANVSSIFGLSTAMVAGCRLWLTHGEVSGLPAAALSAAVTILCLAAAPQLPSINKTTSNNAAAAIVYVTILTMGVLLGFTRAGTLGDVYWADIPLMIGGAICLGLLAAAAFERFGILVKGLCVAVTTFLVITPIALSVAHSLPVIGLSALGAIAVALPLLLSRLTLDKELPVSLGFILVIAGISLAFTLLSGYGMALFALGALTIYAAARSANLPTPLSWIAFSALLLVFRMEILQNDSSVHSVGPADIWDLLAISLGVLLPRLISSLVAALTGRSTGLVALQWLLAATVPAIILDYVWQPRSLTGLFLGLAIGQLTTVSAADDSSELNAINSVLISLLLFLFLSGLDVLPSPTRAERIIAVIVLAVVVSLWIVFHRHSSVRPAKGE